MKAALWGHDVHYPVCLCACLFVFAPTNQRELALVLHQHRETSTSIEIVPMCSLHFLTGIPDDQNLPEISYGCAMSHQLELPSMKNLATNCTGPAGSRLACGA